MNLLARLSALAAWAVLLLPSLALAQPAHVDPPARVAYLNHGEGAISYSPAGEDYWLDVVYNRPLIRGDRLWTDRNARAELHVGGALLRMAAETSLEILELDDRIAQLLVTEGTLALTVRRLQRGEVYEIATPNLAFNIDRVGRYRIDVDPRRDETTNVVWEGAGEAWGDGTVFPLRAGEAVRFFGADLRDYRVYGLPRTDAFDRYCMDRDDRLERSASLRHVDYELIGFSRLDDYGSWRSERDYGYVWFPTRVERGWAPYRDGHWVWQEPWGWTWIDHAPWGFAPSHYGRWVHVSGRWGWVPGPRHLRPVYAPALVVFIGGNNFGLSITSGHRGPVGWFPLGYREVYVPGYHASRDYFHRVNVHNTVIHNTTIINNHYHHYSRGSINITQVNHANRGVRDAVTVVPGDVFVQARPVRQAALSVDSRQLARGEAMRVAQLAPEQRSVRGAAQQASVKPARDTVERRGVVRTPAPASTPPLSARMEQLQQKPGLPAIEPAPTRQAQPAQRNRVNLLQTGHGSINAREQAPRREAAGQPVREPATRAQGEADAAADLQRRQRQADAEQLRRVEMQQEQQRQEQAGQPPVRQQPEVRQREPASQRQIEAQSEQRRREAAEQQRQEQVRQQQEVRQREAASQRQIEAQAEQRRREAAEQQRQQQVRQQQEVQQREAAAQRQEQQRQQQVRQQQEQRSAPPQQTRQAPARSRQQVEEDKEDEPADRPRARGGR